MAGILVGDILLQLMEWDPLALYLLRVYQLEFRVGTCRCDASHGQGVLTQVNCMVKSSL